MNTENVSRRGFLAGAGAVLGAGALGLAASDHAWAADLAAATAEAEIPAEFTDGTYVTSAVSMHGNVYVKTVIKDGAIGDVKVIAHRESYNVGECAVERIPQMIVDSQCIDVDSVAGSTVTSTAIKQAVEAAIVAAGGDPEAFEGYVAPVPEESEMDIEADVAIMGAGPAGLMAAWELAEAGKKVVIFEKMPYVGGCCPLTGGGLYTAETAVQKAWGYEYCTERYSTFEKCIEFRQGQANLDSPLYNPDMPYLTNTIKYASKAVDKMFGIGVGFTPLDRAISCVFAPGDFQIGTKYSIVFIEHYLTKRLGVEIYTEAPVTELTVADGAIAGFTAKGANGTTYHVSAPKVVLASGGYIQNKELMDEYQPNEQRFPIMGPWWTTGEGMIMAHDQLGAAYCCMDQGVTSHYHGGRSLAEISYICYTVPGVIVDATGARFVDETVDYKLTLHMFKEKPSTDFYWVFDEAGFYGIFPSGNSYGIDYRFLTETADLIEGENLQDLAEKAGLPDLVASIEAVNNCVNNGVADEFGNPSLPGMDTTHKMYALSVSPTPYVAQGGLHIDLAAHVLDENGEIIPNLYAAGDITGAVDNLDGHPYNIGLSQAFAYGLIAAETILAE